ncbi:MAG: patatin-like phospholipase family protein [Bacteroidota bacterium]
MKKYVLISLLTALLPIILCAQQNILIHPPAKGGTYKGFHFQSSRPTTRPKIGLVLSGGGARGLAQIGVLRVLEEHHIPIDLIVGNSLGSVVGGLYASGYTIAELESIAIHSDWNKLLSFSEETNRNDLFVEQKQASSIGYLTVRFDGMQPVIPSSISGGQLLTNFFMNLSLQALYHPDTSFDDLKIPYRAVATDLYHGKREILDHGSLAEAMRASVTVPFLYTPLERDSMALVDGGLLSNIPVDVAKSLGCDIIIVVNSTSSLRHESHFGAPWEIADQIMTIMMQSANQLQMDQANIIITPDVGDHSVSQFDSIYTLIQAGDREAEKYVGAIQELIREKSSPVASQYGNKIYKNASVMFTGDSLPPSIYHRIEVHKMANEFDIRSLEEDVSLIYDTGDYRDVSCEIIEHASPPDIIYHSVFNPRIKKVTFSGNSVLPNDTIEKKISRLNGTILNNANIDRALEGVLEYYRQNKYSLARVESVNVDSSSGMVKIQFNEGRLEDIKFEGNDKTKDYVIRREFPLDPNDVFNLDKVREGLINIASTGLFQYVLVDVRYHDRKPTIILKVKEQPSELLLLGLHGDNEHGLVSIINVHDANFLGAGMDLGMLLRYGLRDRGVTLGYKATRIFDTYFTFDLKSYFNSRDIFTYMDDPNSSPLHWERIENGRYRENKYGGSFTFGSQVERLGSVTGQFHAEEQQIEAISGFGYTPDTYRLVDIKLQTTLDTEDKFVFPTNGTFFNFYYDWASKNIGSEIAFSKIGINYESYLTLLNRHTFRPKVTFGFADQTLPLTEQFSLGGYNSFLGLLEDDSRGRQLFLINMLYSYFAPFKLIFDTHLMLRYDLGTISTIPEQLKLNTFRHGIGAIIGLDTPLGAAEFGAGISFIFKRTLPNQPLSNGPLLFYFSVGPSIY